MSNSRIYRHQRQGKGCSATQQSPLCATVERWNALAYLTLCFTMKHTSTEGGRESYPRLPRGQWLESLTAAGPSGMSYGCELRKPARPGDGWAGNSGNGIEGAA